MQTESAMPDTYKKGDDHATAFNLDLLPNAFQKPEKFRVLCHAWMLPVYPEGMPSAKHMGTS